MNTDIYVEETTRELDDFISNLNNLMQKLDDIKSYGSKHNIYDMIDKYNQQQVNGDEVIEKIGQEIKNIERDINKLI